MSRSVLIFLLVTLLLALPSCQNVEHQSITISFEVGDVINLGLPYDSPGLPPGTIVLATYGKITSIKNTFIEVNGLSADYSVEIGQEFLSEAAQKPVGKLIKIKDGVAYIEEYYPTKPH